ncbi:hypothetical protein KBD34_01975 [Patescibacteria group bacterium]|nr:hypothetical protein [Patescibacteria group bacterium]
MHLYSAFSHCSHIVAVVTDSKSGWPSIIEGAAGGITASAVIWGLGWMRDWWNRPIFKARRANIQGTDAGHLVSFDLFFRNDGKRAFLEPTFNIVGLTQQAVSVENDTPVDPNIAILSTATWSPEGDRIVYNHHNSLVPNVSFRLRFKVLDKTKLPDVVQLKLMHLNGIEPVQEVRLDDLKIDHFFTALSP